LSFKILAIADYLVDKNLTKNILKMHNTDVLNDDDLKIEINKNLLLTISVLITTKEESNKKNDYFNIELVFTSKVLTINEINHEITDIEN
jgi:hypothetical protein